MTDIQIAVQLAQQHAPYQRIRDAVARAEDIGVDIVFNWDHFFPLSRDPEGSHFEAWTMLAALAEQTSRVQFGPLVNCTGYRGPDLQADMARTVDHISAHNTGVGRFIFGTGSGWFERDYTEYGYRFGTIASRLDALAKDLPRIRARWEKLNPKPTRNIPILIGGEGEKKTLRLVAEHAQIWHSYADPETLKHKLAVLDAHCLALGRARKEITLSVGINSRHTDAQLSEYHKIGVRIFQVSAAGPDFELSQVNRLMAWRASQT